MENTVNNTTDRIYVKELSSIGGGMRFTLVKPDNREFSDSEVDRIFRKTFEYSNYGPEFIKKYGHLLVVRLRNPQEGREFIKGIAFKSVAPDIINNINIISSEHHDNGGTELTLGKREGGKFSALEINDIFWNAFEHQSVRSFSATSNEEVNIHFHDIGEYCEFIKLFVCEGGEGKKKLYESAKTAEPAKKEEKKGFLSWINEKFHKFIS